MTNKWGQRLRVLIGGLGVVLVWRLASFLPWRVFIVETGSMAPTVPPGSVIFVQKERDYQIGEIITFSSGAASKTKVTHRIVGKKGNFFLTKGDANECVDRKLVAPPTIIGKVVVVCPFLGYPFLWVRHKMEVIGLALVSFLVN